MKTSSTCIALVLSTSLFGCAFGPEDSQPGSPTAKMPSFNASSSTPNPRNAPSEGERDHNAKTPLPAGSVEPTDVAAERTPGPASEPASEPAVETPAVEVAPIEQQPAAEPITTIIDDAKLDVPVAIVADVPTTEPVIDTTTPAPAPETIAKTDDPGTWFDFATGLGFAAKGDVQSGFGWNDAGLTRAVCSAVASNSDCIAYFVPQDLHLWFTLEANDVYHAVCEFTTGEEGAHGSTVHDVTVRRRSFLDTKLTSNARASGAKEITGFELAGVVSTKFLDRIPVVGEACIGGPEGNAQNGTWAQVELVSTNGGVGMWMHTDLAATASDVQIWKY
jgi:hypothetical protein